LQFQLKLLVEKGELHNLQELYKTLATESHTSTNTIKKVVFKTHLLDKFLIPVELADKIATVFAQSGDTINYEAFICGFAMCCKGSIDVKLQFLYELFSKNKLGITQPELERMLKLTELSSLAILHNDILLEENSLKSETEEQLQNRRDEAVQELARDAFRRNKDKPYLKFPRFKEWALSERKILDFFEFLLHSDFEPSTEIPSDLKASIPHVEPMKVLGKSYLMSIEDILKLRNELPLQLQSCAWIQLYSTKDSGFSFGSMMFRLNGKKYHIQDQTILLVSDSEGYVFGAFSSELLRKYSAGFYGDEKTFLFQLKPTFKLFKATGFSRNFIFSDDKGISFGGMSDYPALLLDTEFLNGKSNATDTYKNEILAKESSFQIKSVELWGFVQPDKIQFLDQQIPQEGEQKKKSVLEDKQNTYVLELLGKNYSEMIHE